MVWKDDPGFMMGSRLKRGSIGLEVQLGVGGIVHVTGGNTLFKVSGIQWLDSALQLQRHGLDLLLGD